MRKFTKDELNRLAAGLSLTESEQREWYGDTWTETRENMDAITELVNRAVAIALTEQTATEKDQ